MTDKFTPTEELILDLLVARHRLGEDSWPISTRLKTAVLSLEKSGYVIWRSGPMPSTLSVTLTAKAQEEFILKSKHKPRGFRRYADQIAAYLSALGVDDNIGRIIVKQYGTGLD